MGIGVFDIVGGGKECTIGLQGYMRVMNEMEIGNICSLHVMGLGFATVLTPPNIPVFFVSYNPAVMDQVPLATSERKKIQSPSPGSRLFFLPFSICRVFLILALSGLPNRDACQRVFLFFYLWKWKMEIMRHAPPGIALIFFFPRSMDD